MSKTVTVPDGNSATRPPHRQLSAQIGEQRAHPIGGVGDLREYSEPPTLIRRTPTSAKSESPNDTGASGSTSESGTRMLRGPPASSVTVLIDCRSQVPGA